MLASSTTHAENDEASNNHRQVCNQLGGVKNGIFVEVFGYSYAHSNSTLALQWTGFAHREMTNVLQSRPLSLYPKFTRNVDAS